LLASEHRYAKKVTTLPKYDIEARPNDKIGVLC